MKRRLLAWLERRYWLRKFDRATDVQVIGTPKVRVLASTTQITVSPPTFTGTSSNSTITFRYLP